MEQQTSFFDEKSLEKRSPKRRKRKEESIQIQVSNYLRFKYPDVIFNSDLASGMKLTMGQAFKAKQMRSEKGQPDMIILEPRGEYKGLCIELKQRRDDVYKKDGTISQSKSMAHVRRQNEVLERLKSKGYFAVFGFGAPDCQRIIDEYMSL